METLARILIISNDQLFVAHLRELVTHPQVVVDHSTSISDDPYHFYVVGDVMEITEAVDKIRAVSEGSPIYLIEKACETNVPVRKMIKCNIVGCLENEQEIKAFVKTVGSLCKQKNKIHEASCKLDSLKSGDLRSLARQMKKAESARFVDYIQNHPLPMVLVSKEHEVLHANTAMENTIGIRLPGVSAASYYVDPNQLDPIIEQLKKEGQVLGVEVTLKNSNGEHLQMKLYSSLHHDKEGNWLNTRCLFVPCD